MLQNVTVASGSALASSPLSLSPGGNGMYSTQNRSYVFKKTAVHRANFSRPVSSTLRSARASYVCGIAWGKLRWRAMHIAPLRKGKSAQALVCAAAESGEGGEVQQLAYTVRLNETLYTIAQKHGVMVKEIAEANKMGKTREIYVGQRINLPPHAMEKTAAPALAMAVTPPTFQISPAPVPIPTAPATTSVTTSVTSMPKLPAMPPGVMRGAGAAGALISAGLILVQLGKLALPKLKALKESGVEKRSKVLAEAKVVEVEVEISLEETLQKRARELKMDVGAMKVGGGSEQSKDVEVVRGVQQKHAPAAGNGHGNGHAKPKNGNGNGHAKAAAPPAPPTNGHANSFTKNPELIDVVEMVPVLKAETIASESEKNSSKEEHAETGWWFSRMFGQRGTQSEEELEALKEKQEQLKAKAELEQSQLQAEAAKKVQAVLTPPPPLTRGVMTAANKQIAREQAKAKLDKAAAQMKMENSEGGKAMAEAAKAAEAVMVAKAAELGKTAQAKAENKAVAEVKAEKDAQIKAEAEANAEETARIAAEAEAEAEYVAEMKAALQKEKSKNLALRATKADAKVKTEAERIVHERSVAEEARRLTAVKQEAEETAKTNAGLDVHTQASLEEEARDKKAAAEGKKAQAAMLQGLKAQAKKDVMEAAKKFMSTSRGGVAEEEEEALMAEKHAEVRRTGEAAAEAEAEAMAAEEESEDAAAAVTASILAASSSALTAQLAAEETESALTAADDAATILAATETAVAAAEAAKAAALAIAAAAAVDTEGDEGEMEQFAEAAQSAAYMELAAVDVVGRKATEELAYLERLRDERLDAAIAIAELVQACEKKVRAATLERDGALALQSANANQIMSVASGVTSMQSASKSAKQEVAALKAQLEVVLLKDVKGVAAAAEAAAADAITAIEAAKQAEANAEVKAAAVAEAEEKKAEAEGKRRLVEEALEAAHVDVITAQAASEATEMAALAAVEEATSVGVATAQEYEAVATTDKEAAAELKAAEAAAATAATSLLSAEAKGKSTLADAEALGLALGAVQGKAAKAAINVESLASAEASLAKLVEAMPTQASLHAATASQLKVASKTLAALKAQVLSDGRKAEAASTASATAAVLLEAEKAREVEAREAREWAMAQAEGAKEKLLATRAAAAAGSRALEAAENALQTATLAGAESIKAAVAAAAAATVTETKANTEWAAAAEVANEAAAASAEAKAEDEAAAAAAAEAEVAKVDAKVVLDSAKAKRADGIIAALSAKEEEVKLRVEQATHAASSATEEAERLTSSASSILAAAERTLDCHLEDWERNVDQLAVKETTVCGLDARIAELKADILVKVAAHDALQLASAALSRAAVANDSKAVLAAAKEVELASNDISRVIGDPQKSRRDLLDTLAREEASVVVGKQARQVALALNFIPPAQELCLLKPVQIPMAAGAPLLVYIPGLDGTGQGIRRQIEALHFAGYDVRCVYIPPTDRSTWQQLASAVLPLVEAAARENASGREFSHATLLSESFFAPLALRLAAAAPALVSRLVLVNPATHFSEVRPGLGAAAEMAAGFGLLELIPDPVYQAAQDMVQQVLVQRSRVNEGIPAKDLKGHCYPVDIPAAAASWRLSLLRTSSLPDDYLMTIKQPTLVVVAGQDAVNPSLQEGLRLQRLLPNSTRVVFPDSGHTLLLEDDVSLVECLDVHGFVAPAPGAPTSGEDDIDVEASVMERIKGIKGRRSNLTRSVSDEDMEGLGRVINSWKQLTSPHISGVKNLPDPIEAVGRPVLFVGNHTSLGMYDLPLLVHELYLRGFSCRALAHPMHWLGPTGAVIERFGGAKATPYEAHQLLKNREHLLLFPGGKGEVTTNRSETNYSLHWREHADYVAMAKRFNAIIVPFAALGADDTFAEPARLDDLLSGPAGPLVRSLIGELSLEGAESEMNPIGMLPDLGLPGLPLPSLQRVYIHFCEVVDTADWHDDDEAKLVTSVHRAVETGVQRLMQTREADPERGFQARMMAKASGFVPQLSTSRLAATMDELFDGVTRSLSPPSQRKQ